MSVEPKRPVSGADKGASVPRGQEEQQEQSLAARERGLAQREAAVQARERAVREGETRNAELRDANEHLILATLAAEQMEEAALKTKRQQDEFLAMLAHELRNPLAPIRSAVSVIERLDLGSRRLDDVCGVVKRQVEHMARLLDDLLDASRVNRGKVTLQRRPTNVRDFIDQAVEIYLPLIDAQRQQLTLDLPATPLYVDGDPTRLAQMVGNLLHNAAKYTSPGGTISVNARADGDLVALRVSDNGNGISAEALEYVFDLFTQEEHSLSRSQGGLGIGLTVVRELARQHGGSISARSEGPGRGSEFTLILPRLAHVAEPVFEQTTSTEFVPARILVVDDNVDAAGMLQTLLELSGYEVELALDGIAGLAAFESKHFAFVLCDIGLPGLDGYEVARRIRERTAGKSPVPYLIALTGYDAAEDRARAIAAGFDRHFAKPVDIDELLTHLQEASVG
ncbi:MAG: putative signal transduction histidine kinase [Variovorax sp.]|nr:putative signal transduction histidine kinase [Variovorax sp.]